MGWPIARSVAIESAATNSASRTPELRDVRFCMVLFPGVTNIRAILLYAFLLALWQRETSSARACVSVTEVSLSSLIACYHLVARPMGLYDGPPGRLFLRSILQRWNKPLHCEVGVAWANASHALSGSSIGYRCSSVSSRRKACCRWSSTLPTPSGIC
jgi:hypothetical protein